MTHKDLLYGMDYLGGARYKDVVVHSHPNGWAAGFFSKVDGFGDALPTVEALIATGRCPAVRIHLLWDDDHNYTEAHIKKAVREALRVQKLVNKYPMIKWFISPICEHRLSEVMAQRFCEAVKEVMQFVTIVNTPEKGAVLKNYLNEFHGADSKPRTKAPYLFSFDGTPCTDADIETYKDNFSEATIFFFHESRLNGRWESNDTTPRPQRKGWPDREFINSLAYLANDKGDTNIDKKTLYKSHSENKGTGDKRAEKPVIITPVKVDAIELKTNNKVIATLPRYKDPYQDGRQRYYASEMGFKIAKKAGGLVEIWAGKKKLGVINPGFRDGGFRD